MNDFTIVFSTSDKYFDLCDGFFTLLKKYWPEYSGDIIFTSQTKTYYNNNYNIINAVHNEPNFSWSQLLYDAIKLVKTEHFVLLLDDYYLEDRVNHKEFIKCLEYAKTNNNVKAIHFTKENGTTRPVKELKGFSYRKQFALYKMSTQIGLFRTDFFKEMLKINENPWEAEIYGSFRAFFRKGIFICKTDDYHIFPYSHGKLVSRGKYNNELKRYFETKENIEFSNKRDVYCEEKEIVSSKKKRIMYLLKAPLSFFKRKPK